MSRLQWGYLVGRWRVRPFRAIVVRPFSSCGQTANPDAVWWETSLLAAPIGRSNWLVIYMIQAIANPSMAVIGPKREALDQEPTTADGFRCANKAVKGRQASGVKFKCCPLWRWGADQGQVR